MLNNRNCYSSKHFLIWNQKNGQNVNLMYFQVPKVLRHEWVSLTISTANEGDEFVIRRPLLVLIVNLMDSRITKEMGPWACLWGIILITLIELGRPGNNNNGWHQSLAGILGSTGGKGELSSNLHSCTLCFVNVDAMGPASSRFYYSDFLAMVD